MSTLSSPAVIQGLSLSRNELIKLYFYEGYEYSLIVFSSLRAWDKHLYSSAEACFKELSSS